MSHASGPVANTVKLFKCMGSSCHPGHTSTRFDLGYPASLSPRVLYFYFCHSLPPRLRHRRLKRP